MTTTMQEIVDASTWVGYNPAAWPTNIDGSLTPTLQTVSLVKRCPADYTFDDVTAAFTDQIGEPVSWRYVLHPGFGDYGLAFVSSVYVSASGVTLIELAATGRTYRGPI